MWQVHYYFCYLIIHYFLKYFIPYLPIHPQYSNHQLACPSQHPPQTKTNSDTWHTSPPTTPYKPLYVYPSNAYSHPIIVSSSSLIRGIITIGDSHDLALSPGGNEIVLISCPIDPKMETVVLLDWVRRDANSQPWDTPNAILIMCLTP